jgi:hypothetical protein
LHALDTTSDASLRLTQLVWQGLDMAHGRQAARDEALLGEETTHCSSRKALLLLGMHRSGTSLLAYLLHARGAALPDNIIGPGHGNPLGHWEPRDLVSINDDALRALGRSWNDPRSIDQAWFRSSDACDFIDRIIIQIDRDYRGAPLLLIKDPRICRLLPLYLTALEALNIEPLVIHQLRPFPEVGRSLADRNDIDLAVSELLWARSIIEGEQISRPCRRVWATLEQVLADWQATTSRIAMTLGFEWTEISEETAAQAMHFVDPRMCHGQGQSTAGIDRSCWLAPRVWAAAQHGLAGNEGAMRAGFDELQAALQELDRMTECCVAKLVQPHEAKLADVYRSTSWRITAPLRAIKRLMLCVRFGA